MSDSSYTTQSPYIAEIKAFDRIHRHYDFPPDSVGFAISSDQFEMLDQGGDDIFSQLGNKKIDFVGYFPKHPFLALMAIDKVLSGDGQLIDLRLELQIAVEEPQSFIEKVLFVDKAIPKNDYYLKSIDYAEEIAVFLYQYEANDIISARLGPELEANIKQNLGKLLRKNGLRLLGIKGISVWHSSERATVMSKIASNLGKIKTQNDLNVFLQNESLQDKVSVQQLDTNDKADDHGAWFDSLKAIFTTEESGRNYRMKRIINSIKTKIEQGPTEVKPRWWITTITWIVLSLLSGYGLTMLIIGKSQTLSPWKIATLVLNWLGILTFIFYRIWWLVKKIKKVKQNAHAVEAAKPKLSTGEGANQLKQSNKEEVNRRVREQVANELRHQKNVLEGLRTKAYKAGFDDQALYIHQLLKVVEDKTNLVLNPTYAVPVYLQDTRKLTEENWEALLDGEETLLIKAALLSQEVDDAGRGKSAEDEKLSLVEYEDSLNAFMNDFVTRSRLVQQ